ncbi:uncharacterized protein LOC142336523 [Convolutriloba macropyga]|uniref:uncharacterized protein LOC142336523 n=1 Tax=Convolutriloba macropyga TaxID=536237 RepID=UPI003F5234FD
MALTKGTTGNRANLEPKVSINITGPSEERVDGNGAQITIEKVDKPVPNSNVLGGNKLKLVDVAQKVVEENKSADATNQAKSAFLSLLDKVKGGEKGEEGEEMSPSDFRIVYFI